MLLLPKPAGCSSESNMRALRRHSARGGVLWMAAEGASVAMDAAVAVPVAVADRVVSVVPYVSEAQMAGIMALIAKDLSEPYSIYTYRYFIHNWPHLCFLAMDGDRCVGAIVCKLDLHFEAMRGYIAMLAVEKEYRKHRLGTRLVSQAIDAMAASGADEVVLETELTNTAALALYENLGFVRDKRLFRYYLNGGDAHRLKLWLR